MADITYTIRDFDLDNVAVITSGSVSFELTGFTPRGVGGGDRDVVLIYPTVPIEDTDYLRLDLYNNDVLVNTFEGIANEYIVADSYLLKIDLYSIIVEKLGIQSGQFNIIGYIVRKTQDISVFEISQNKTEIKLDKPLLDIRSIGDDPIPLYLRHPSTNTTLTLVEWINDKYSPNNNIIFKTATSIPRTIRPYDVVEIWDYVINPFSFDVVVSIFAAPIEESGSLLKGPDFYVDVNKRVGKGTGLLSEERILDALPDVKNKIISKLFSSSFYADTSELNIDYRKYENFIHFSSAEQRLTNFYYKMTLIENYQSQSSAISTDLSGLSLSAATASYVYVNNKQTIDDKITDIIKNLDTYEQYMYYESASAYTDTYDTYYDTTWPKNNSSRIYSNASVTSSIVQTWYTESLEKATLYDLSNNNILRDLIPLHVRFDSQNNGFVLFVDMIAQHFDMLYNYINHLNNINKKDESLEVGISKDLLYSVLESMGWEALSGWDSQELWSYILGSDSSGSYHSTSSTEYPSGAVHNYVLSESISYKDMELEPYSRIYNNLPFIYKTKGTERSIRAFLACYGIPTSILRIQEFGGPDQINSISGSQMRALEVANYELITSGSYIKTPWHNVRRLADSTVLDNDDLYTPRTIEFRFRTGEKVNQGLAGKINETENPNTNTWALWLQHSSSVSSSNYGRVHFSISGSAGWISASTEYIPIYDNDYWSVFLRQERRIPEAFDTWAGSPPFPFDAPGAKWYLDVKKAPNHADGRITHAVSTSLSTAISLASITASYIESWVGYNDPTYIELGRVIDPKVFSPVSTNYTSSFNGALQEYRLWRSFLPDYVMEGHTQAPTSYFSTNYTESFNSLVYRLPLGTDNYAWDISTNGNIISSSHPSQINQFGQTASVQPIAEVYNYSNSNWNTIDDTYYIHVPNSIGIRSISSKIRIEDNTTDELLDPFISYERSSFDNNALDSNMVSVAFSPQDNIDLDISLQFGGISLDDIIGDPRDRFLPEYSLLRNLRDAYFIKFKKENNIFAFLRLITLFNSAIFKQIEQLLPARAHKVVGVLIKPSIIERPKIVTEPSLSFSIPYYTGSIDAYGDSMLDLSDDLDSMVYEGRYGETSLYSTLTDEIATWDISGYDTRYGSRYSFDELAFIYTTSSISFSFDVPTAVPTGSITFVGSSVQFVYTASAAMGINTPNIIYIPNDAPALNTSTKIARALRDSINNSSSLIEIPLSASNLSGTINIFYTRLNSPVAKNIRVYTGSAPNGELDSLTINITSATQSFVGGDRIFNSTVRIYDAVMPFVSESYLSEVLYKPNYFYSSSYSKSIDNFYSKSEELSRLHPLTVNSLYIGSKMTSADFNIDSPDTIDGKPVVQYAIVTGSGGFTPILAPDDPDTIIL